MFMRKGCLFGCGGWLVACVAIALIGWFVVVPRVTDSFEESIADGMSTIIADEINPFYSRSELQQGADVRFSFSTLNHEFETSQGDTVDTFRISAQGDELVLAVTVSDQTFDLAFVPRVTSSGELELAPVDDGGWWQRQFMGVLSGGFERAVNDWMDRNDLRLVDVALDGDTLILSVTGK